MRLKSNEATRTYSPGSPLNCGRAGPKEVMVSKGTMYMLAAVYLLLMFRIGALSCM